MPPSLSAQSSNRNFSTTRWSMVAKAGDNHSSQAMEELLRDYWFPLYSFVRRSGLESHDAQDVTQGFLAYLLERDAIGQADQSKGRFRSYLLGALKNFMANSHRSDSAQKRGGGVPLVSIDEEHSEERFQLELRDNLSPSDQYEHSWAMALLARVMELLRAEFEAAGRLPLFEALQSRLTGSSKCETYAAIAARLDLSESAVTVSVHRMRKRYGELLRETIAETVLEPEDIEPELQHLLNIVSR